MIRLNYKYAAGTNKLIRVADQVAVSTDAQSGASITWSPYGKVLEVYRSALVSTMHNSGESGQ